jgi:hypothetical protein
MFFLRKPFLDTIKLMNPLGGALFFRDSMEEGYFEVVACRKTKYANAVLMRALFPKEAGSIFAEDLGSIGDSFYADIGKVVSALAAKDTLAEYKEGLFDGVSVDRYVPDPDMNASSDKDPVYWMKWHEQQPEPEVKYVIPRGAHCVISHGITQFPSIDETRYTMNSVCFNFIDSNKMQIAATNGRSLAVYDLPGASNENPSGTWTVSPDMLLVPSYGYESVMYSFSKNSVSATIRGDSAYPILVIYDIAIEWQHLKAERDELLRDVLNGRRTQEDVDYLIAKIVSEGPKKVFPNYTKVIPEKFDNKLIIDKAEVELSLEKIKQFLYKEAHNRVFIIDALDSRNIFLTSMIDTYKGPLSYISTQIPLRKAEVTHPMRVIFTRSLFEMCFLEGGEKAEFSCNNSRGAFMTEGIDFYKGSSVKVRKLFMPNTLSESFDEYGVFIEDDDK